MKDLTKVSKKNVFYSHIYKDKELAHEFLFGADYECFARLVQTRFKLTPKQWQEVLAEWEQKEEILA